MTQESRCAARTQARKRCDEFYIRSNKRTLSISKPSRQDGYHDEEAQSHKPQSTRQLQKITAVAESAQRHDIIIQETRRELKCIKKSIASALLYFGDQTRAGGGNASANDHNEAHEKWYGWLRTVRQRNGDGTEIRSSTDTMHF